MTAQVRQLYRVLKILADIEAFAKGNWTMFEILIKGHEEEIMKIFNYQGNINSFQQIEKKSKVCFEIIDKVIEDLDQEPK